MSVVEIMQFCIVPKITVAFSFPFVYNVPIRVSSPNWKVPLPERSKINNVHR